MYGRYEIIRIQTHHLRQGGVLLRTIEDDACLSMIYGEGGGSTLEVTGGAAGIWIPLRGTLHVDSAGLNRPVCAPEIFITEHEARSRAVAHGGTRWVALLGNKRVWALLLKKALAPDCQLLPATYRIDRQFKRRVVALARSTLPFELECAAHAAADAVATLQTSWHGAIARCPGRTYEKRRQVFVRLQRVRHFISACCDEELDNDSLARMASYSYWHFLRTFNAVYQETPHAYLVSQRLKWAERLLKSSGLSITEVALASGFENRSTFSRLFHQRFGTTAHEARRQFRALPAGAIYT